MQVVGPPPHLPVGRRGGPSALWVRALPLIGDAAVGMHPVTAHGYNLGLYGIEALARRLDPNTDPGALVWLLAHEAEHRREAGPIYTGTNALVRFFTDDRAPVLALRRAVIDVGAPPPPPLRAAITRKLVDAGCLTASATQGCQPHHATQHQRPGRWLRHGRHPAQLDRTVERDARGQLHRQPRGVAEVGRRAKPGARAD